MANILGDMCVSWDFSLSDYKVVGLEDKSQDTDTDMCSSCPLSLSNKRCTCHSLDSQQPTQLSVWGLSARALSWEPPAYSYKPKQVSWALSAPSLLYIRRPIVPRRLSIAPILRNPLHLNCWHDIADCFDGKPSLRHVCFLGFHFEREVQATPVSMHRKPFL